MLEDETAYGSEQENTNSITSVQNELVARHWSCFFSHHGESHKIWNNWCMRKVDTHSAAHKLMESGKNKKQPNL
mgnify:CR=1 FL=1